MIIAAEYQFNQGEYIYHKYPQLLDELNEIINSVDASTCRTKESSEVTMPGRTLYSPIALNKAFDQGFTTRGWAKKRVPCTYPTTYYRSGYTPKPLRKGAYREMDYLKESLGIEVQFGKYAFMVYNVCAKMTIFRNLGHIDAGIEIVPVKSLAAEMSTGVSYFEQIAWDLETRGAADIDVPVLIFGIDA